MGKYARDKVTTQKQIRRLRKRKVSVAPPWVLVVLSSQVPIPPTETGEVQKLQMTAATEQLCHGVK